MSLPPRKSASLSVNMWNNGWGPTGANIAPTNRTEHTRMPLNRILCTAAAATALAFSAGCTTLHSPPEAANPTAPASLYDSTLIASHAAQAITLAQLGQELADADVVIIGEYHGHQASHLLQSRCSSSCILGTQGRC